MERETQQHDARKQIKVHSSSDGAQIAEKRGVAVRCGAVRCGAVRCGAVRAKGHVPTTPPCMSDSHTITCTETEHLAPA
jgi:hypothetical protein